jgi:tetratricopeptide (TPR) repeat protein
MLWLDKPAKRITPVFMTSNRQQFCCRFPARHHHTVMKLALLIPFLMLALSTSCTKAPPGAAASRSQQLAGESAAAFNAEDYSKAQALAAEATRLKPQFAEAWVAYGMASVRLGQTDPAREAYGQALSLYQARHRQNPSDPDQAFQQIFVLSLLGRQADAEVLLKQSRIDYPQDQPLARLAQDFAGAKEGWAGLTVEAKR